MMIAELEECRAVMIAELECRAVMIAELEECRVVMIAELVEFGALMIRHYRSAQVVARRGVWCVPDDIQTYKHSFSIQQCYRTTNLTDNHTNAFSRSSNVNYFSVCVDRRIIIIIIREIDYINIRHSPSASIQIISLRLDQFKLHHMLQYFSKITVPLSLLCSINDKFSCLHCGLVCIRVILPSLF